MVFADTLFWVAIIKPGDQWKEPAVNAKRALGNVRLLTTDGVLTEFLNIFSEQGDHLRTKAVEMVKKILGDPNVTVLPQTREAFLEGLSLYQERSDKEYSLTDCISMKVMKSHSINEALTNDHHFEQEGFQVLIKKQ